MTIKKLKSIDIINVLSDLVSDKLKSTVKLPRNRHHGNYIPVRVNSTIEGVKVNSTVRVKSTGKM